MLVFRGVYHYPSLKQNSKKPQKNQWLEDEFPFIFGVFFPGCEAPGATSESTRIGVQVSCRPAARFRPRQETNRVANSYPRN